MRTIVIPRCRDNAAPAVVAALKQIVPGEETKIVFEKGTYHFYKDGCFRKFIDAAHLSKTEKYVMFLLENAENVTVDGQDSEFMFHDRMFPFALIGCKNVLLKNFTIDFSFSRFCQGRIVASDENSFEMEIDKSLFDVSVNEKGNLIFKCGDMVYSSTDRPVLFANASFGKRPWDYIFCGEDHQSREHLPTLYMETDPVETERGIRFTYKKDSERLVFDVGDEMFFNYELRENINILSLLCKDITVQNVRMYRGGGMGVVVEHSENFTADRVQIMVRPGRNECRSTTADGMFFTQNKGQITVRNSVISQTLDDALNIHGFYTVIQSLDGAHKLTVKDGLKDHHGTLPFEPGDVLTVSDGTTHNGKGLLTVSNVEFNADKTYAVEVAEDLSAFAAGDILENDCRAADFLFENNWVYQAPHMRVSDNGKIVIRNNRIEKLCAIFVCDLLAYWFESGAVRDLTIENNEFINCPMAGTMPPVFVESQRNKTTDIRHSCVRVLNNSFLVSNGNAISIGEADGVIVKGNTFSEGNPEDLIKIINCTGVTVKENYIQNTQKEITR